MDEDEKKELLEKIMEQRKLWKGNAKTDRISVTSSQPSQEESEETTTKADPDATIPLNSIPIEIAQEDDPHADHNDNESVMDNEKLSFRTELGKMGELGTKVILAVICILIFALLMGVLIGYGITALDF